MHRTAWFLTGLLLLLATVAGAGERKVLEATIVRINDRILTISDFRSRLQQDLSQRPDRPQPGELRGFAEELLDDVIDEMVLLEHAQAKRIKVEESQVDEAIKTLREENNLQDDDAFQAALSSSGMTVDMLRDRYRQTIILQRAVRSEVKPAEITEEEIHRRYEEELERFRVPPKVKLEQLFFPVAQDDDGNSRDRDQVRRRAQGLVKRVNGGSDLAAEATLAGIELQSLGEIPVSDLRPELAEVIEGIDEGTLARPLSVPGGYQVLRLVERVPPGYQPFEDVKDELRRALFQERYEEQSTGLIERLKRDFLVVVNRDMLDVALAGTDNV